MDFWTNLQKKRDAFDTLATAHKALVEESTPLKLESGSTIVDPSTAWGYVRRAFDEYDKAARVYDAKRAEIAGALRTGDYARVLDLTTDRNSTSDHPCDVFCEWDHTVLVGHLDQWAERLSIKCSTHDLTTAAQAAEKPRWCIKTPYLFGFDSVAYEKKWLKLQFEIQNRLSETILSVWPECKIAVGDCPLPSMNGAFRIPVFPGLSFNQNGLLGTLIVGGTVHKISSLSELEPLLPLVRKATYEAYLKSQIVPLPTWIGDSTLPTNPKTLDPNDVGFANHKKGGKTYKPLTAKLLDIQAFVCAGVPKLRLLFGVVSGVDTDNNDLRGRTFIADRAVESYGTAAELAEMGLVAVKPDNTKDLASSMQAIASQTFDPTEKAKLIDRVPLLAIGIELDSFAGRTLRRVDFIGRGGK